MKLLCEENYYMDDGTLAFIEGCLYTIKDIESNALIVIDGLGEEHYLYREDIISMSPHAYMPAFGTACPLITEDQAKAMIAKVREDV